MVGIVLLIRIIGEDILCIRYTVAVRVFRFVPAISLPADFCCYRLRDISRCILSINTDKIFSCLSITESVVNTFIFAVSIGIKQFYDGHFICNTTLDRLIHAAVRRDNDCPHPRNTVCCRQSLCPYLCRCSAINRLIRRHFAG